MYCDLGLLNGFITVLYCPLDAQQLTAMYLTVWGQTYEQTNNQTDRQGDIKTDKQTAPLQNNLKSHNFLLTYIIYQNKPDLAAIAVKGLNSI